MIKDSSLEKWEYKEHTRVKHILLEKYMVPWLFKLGSANKKICYFDCFAGKGKYNDGTEGSPIKVLKVADDNSDKYNKLICTFIEKEKENFNNLKEKISQKKELLINSKKIKIIYFNDTFENIADEILNNLGKENLLLAPSFFFIDPFGFSGIPFNIIKKILSNPGTEIFYTFMVRDISRFLSANNIKGTFYKLFGDDEWKKLINESEREKSLIELYRKKLHENANLKYSLCFRVCETEKERTLYYLIHATNHIDGHKIMKSIMYNQCSEGSFAYLGPNDVSARSQISLFDIHDLGELKKILLDRFNGVEISYDDIQEEICHPWFSEPPYSDKNFREVLKKLEKNNIIKVERITSKTDRGLSGSDIIYFPSK